MKIAFVYDRVNKWGGAESVLLALHEIWPNAPLYTSVYDKNLAPWAYNFDVRTAFIQNSPLPKNKHEYYPFLMGLAFETLSLDEFDVVISITSEFAKAVLTKPKTMHLCYCLTPTSYLWSGYEQYFSDKSQLFKSISSPLVKYLRFYDKIICHRPDTYVAISHEVQNRIEKYYGQTSALVYPPVSLPKTTNTEYKIQDTGYFLMVCRLVPNKRVDLAVQAFNKLGLPLKIVGMGRQETALKQLAKANIEFLGSLTSEELDGYYRNCRALIVPAAEDFGIVAVEAQSYGKPVIALRAGGNQETILEGKTGFFFDEPSVSSLVKTIKNANLGGIDPRDCQKNAARFSKEEFKVRFKNLVTSKFEDYTRHV